MPKFIFNNVRNEYTPKPLFEERLFEELGVADDVLETKNKIVDGIKELIYYFKTDFTKSNVNKQHTNTRIPLGEKYIVNIDLTITYYKNVDVFIEKSKYGKKDAKYEPWHNTLFVNVDVINKRANYTQLDGLVQHELNHAYQALLRFDKGIKTVAPESYGVATQNFSNEDAVISAASMAVYYMNCGELSANANELYPHLLNALRKGNLDFDAQMKNFGMYVAVLRVRKLNQRIEKEGRKILANASVKLGVPIGKLTAMCQDFPKYAMAYIGKVYSKAKKDYDEEMRAKALDYGLNEVKKRYQNKLAFFLEKDILDNFS